MAYINLNDNISVDLNNGQFVGRTDILTEYSDKLKIYQSTTHDNNGQNFAWIKVAPQCSYDLYLIANSEKNWDYICISEGYVETLMWEYAPNSNLTKHVGGDVNYRNIFKWTKTQISNNTNEDKYYTVIWGKDGSGNSNEDIGMFAINITTETIVNDTPFIDLNENLSVDLNNRQFVERTDILTEYSDKLKIYQSTTHDNNGQNFAWIKVAPHCSYDLYLIDNSEKYLDYICVFEGYYEKWEHAIGGTYDTHYGGYNNYRYLGNWKKMQISNYSGEDKYYTVIWRKVGSVNKYEDIGLFAINITNETIEPSPIIELNDNISLDLGGGQFVERTDILTEYSDKLKIYQSTAHVDNGQSYAWIKLAPHCSYDLYIIANSEVNFDYISIFEEHVDVWEYGSGGYVTQHAGGNLSYRYLSNWTKTQISNNTDTDKYYTVIWAKNSTDSANEDIGMFAINITTETIVSLPEIELNENISVDLNNGQFVERTDIMTGYSDKLKIYQSTAHVDNGQSYAWIKLAPNCSCDLYLIANSEPSCDYICICEGKLETWAGGYVTQHAGGNLSYRYLGNWTKTQISNNTDTDKYYTVVWSKNASNNYYEDIGLFAINITNETIVPEIDLSLINLNENISVSLGDGQFVERTDIFTKYSDQLKIYQSTSHRYEARNFAWIKLAPHCSYDFYLVANSDQGNDFIYIFEGYVETLKHGAGGAFNIHFGGDVDYTDINNWNKKQIYNNTDTDKYYTVIWAKNSTYSANEDIGMFAINITNETLFIPPSDVLFQNNKRMFYFGNEFVRHIKYNDVNVNNIGTLKDYSSSNGVWSTIEGWWGTHNSLLEQWNIMRPVWFKSNTFSDSTPLSIWFNIFYREGLAEDAIIIGGQVNAILSVYDADGNRISKQEKPIPRTNKNGITEEENTSLSLGFTVINTVGLYVPNTMAQTQAAFTNFPDLYKVKFDDVTIPTGGRYEIFFTSVRNPSNSWIIWDTNVKENIL